MAPLAGPPLPPSACGPGHVHPHISHQDQLPQHQADSRRVTLCRLSAITAPLRQLPHPLQPSPGSSLLPWPLGCRRRRGEINSPVWKERKAMEGGSEGPGPRAATSLQARGSRGTWRAPGTEWLSLHHVFAHLTSLRILTVAPFI